MKKISKIIAVAALITASVVTITSCNKDGDVQPDNNGDNNKTIVQIASDDANFSILVDALVKADLVTSLQGEGPFTVFAPTNEAFNALFGEIGVSGIDELDANTLKPILLNHVLLSSAKSSTLSTGFLPTLNISTPDNLGTNLFIETGNVVKINGTANVTMADIEATNGIIHVVDQVIMPASIVDFAISNPDFSVLAEAVVKAGLVNALSGDGPFTLFAPTNEAFQILFNDLGITGIADLSAETLTPILLYHVVEGNTVSTEVETGMVPTLNETASLTIDVSGSGVMINGNSDVIAVDVQGTNGVVHAINRVLLP